MFLYEIFLYILSNINNDEDSSSENNNLVFLLYQDIVEYLNSLISGGKKKLYDLSMDCVNNSFQIFNSIDWKNEPLNSLKEKIEKLFIKQKTVATIYTTMKSYLKSSFVDSVIPEVFKSLVLNYKKSLENMTKIENKNASKQ